MPMPRVGRVQPPRWCAGEMTMNGHCRSGREIQRKSGGIKFEAMQPRASSTDIPPPVTDELSRAKLVSMRVDRPPCLACALIRQDWDVEPSANEWCLIKRYADAHRAIVSMTEISIDHAAFARQCCAADLTGMSWTRRAGSVDRTEFLRHHACDMTNEPHLPRRDRRDPA